MKQKQLLISVAVLVILGIVAFLASRSGGKKSDAAILRGQKILEDWPVNDIKHIQIKNHEYEVNLAKPNNRWVVSDRKNFPADPSKVGSMLIKLWETQVTQAFKAGSSQDERFKLVPPDGEGKDENMATKVTFTDKGNSEIGHVLIGKYNPPGAPAPSADPMSQSSGRASRFLRTSKNDDAVLEVPNNFSEDLSGSGFPSNFGSIEADPGQWLDKEDFIKVQKIETLAVNYREGDDESYALRRESDTADYELQGEIPEGKVLDGSKVSRLKTILFTDNFEDLLTEEQSKEIDEAKTTEAILTTFEGFTYQILIGKKDDDTSRIPIKFTVSDDFPTERKVPEGTEETEEDRKNAETDFQTKLKESKEKLEREKALEGHWFTLSSYDIDPLLKSRPDLLKDEEDEEDEDTAAVGDPPKSIAKPDNDPTKVTELPPGVKPRIEAVSEPVRIPPIPPEATATTPPIEIPRPTTPPDEGSTTDPETDEPDEEASESGEQ